MRGAFVERLKTRDLPLSSPAAAVRSCHTPVYDPAFPAPHAAGAEHRSRSTRGDLGETQFPTVTGEAPLNGP